MQMITKMMVAYQDMLMVRFGGVVFGAHLLDVFVSLYSLHMQMSV